MGEGSGESIQNHVACFMKFLFIVQGEGRGHMTQAISLGEMLRSQGHEVVKVLVAKSAGREVPKFFYEKIKAPVEHYESPNFVFDSTGKKVNVWISIAFNFLKIFTYAKSVWKISQQVKESQPDIIINFYDIMGGFYALFFRPQAEMYCMAHQFLLLHPKFVFPKGFGVDKFLVNLYSRITAIGSEKRLALSFKPMADVSDKKIYVVPPLLRPEVRALTPVKGKFILGYLLNSAYADDIEIWHKDHPKVELHLFWDKKDVPEELKVSNNLTFHKINDVKFLDYMSKCGALVTTAGFESVCEAMYFGKPIMMVPTLGHFEQACNALDASRVGAGIQNDKFDLSTLLEYIPKHKDISKEFRQWADSSKDKFLKLLVN